MGLFSFLKNAGAKLLGRDAAKNDAEKAADETAAKLAKTNALLGAVNASGIVVEGLSLELSDETVIVYGQAQTFAEKEKVVLIVGNVEGISCVDDRMSVLVQEPESDFYEVVSGDTLSKISKKYYGDAMKYPVIFEANKPMLTSPDLIYPGQMLRIPKLA